MPGTSEETEFRIAAQEFDPAIPVGSIREHPENYNQADIGAISESIDAHGLYGAIVVQKSTGYVIAGNGRYRTCVAKGAQAVPGFLLDVDDDEAERILAVDNRLAHLATVDVEQLVKVLARAATRTGNLGGTGYDGDDLDAMVKSLQPGRPGGGGDDEGDGDGWPVLRFKVAPGVRDAFYELTDGSGEKDDTSRFLWLVKQQAGEP